MGERNADRIVNLFEDSGVDNTVRTRPSLKRSRPLITHNHTIAIIPGSLIECLRVPIIVRWRI